MATPFSGNVPLFDIVAVDADGRTLALQVKATRGDNWPTDARTWMDLDLDPGTGVQNYRGPRVLANPGLIWVCVALAPSDDARDRFFVLTLADVQRACIASYCDWMEPHGWRRPRTQTSFDCRFSVAHIQGFENNWDLVRRALAAAAVPLDLRSAEAT